MVTAEEYLYNLGLTDEGLEIRRHPKSGSDYTIKGLIESHTQAHTKELRERVKELEGQNKRLKIAHYTIVRAYEEYGPLASVSTKKVSENVLKETGFDPSKETL